MQLNYHCSNAKPHALQLWWFLLSPRTPQTQTSKPVKPAKLRYSVHSKLETAPQSVCIVGVDTCYAVEANDLGDDDDDDDDDGDEDAHDDGGEHEYRNARQKGC